MVDEEEKLSIANDALKVASIAQKVSLKRVIESEDAIDEMFFDIPGAGPAGGGGQSPAFTVPGQSRIFVIKDRLFRSGRREYPEEAIYALLSHEAGHLSLTPIYWKGEVLEILAIVYQPGRDVRFPLPAMTQIATDGNFRNFYEDALINFKIVNNSYINDRPEIRRKMAEGLIYVYDDMFGDIDNNQNPPLASNMWEEISYQAARRVLHDMGVSPYDSEGYRKEEWLEKLDDLDFKFGETDRPKHNKKLAEFMWYLRFDAKADELVRRLSDSNIKKWVKSESKMRPLKFRATIERQYAKSILMNQARPIPERMIGDDEVNKVRSQAREKWNKDYDNLYPGFMDEFSRKIGLRRWEDVKDQVIGAGAPIP